MLFRGVLLTELVEVSRAVNQNRWDEVDPVERELKDYDVLFVLGDTGAMVLQDNDAGELLLGRILSKTLPRDGLDNVICAHTVQPQVGQRLRLWAGRELCSGVVLYDRHRRLAYATTFRPDGTTELRAIEDVELQIAADIPSVTQTSPPPSSRPPVTPRAPTSRRSGAY